MTWNHRVVKRTHRHTDGAEEVLFGIHEVYYDRSGRPEMCTWDPIRIQEDSLEDLAGTIDWLRAALEKPVLDFDAIGASEGDLAP